MKGLPPLKRNFGLLDREQQFRLAHETIQTRAPELRLAYPKLMDVGFGYKTRRRQGSDDAQLIRKVCITFVVERKWRRGTGLSDPQHLPAHLLAFADVGGERVLCAIPTDVRRLADYGKPTPKAGGILPRPYGVNVDRAQATDYVVGALTCAVRRPLQPGKLFVLSCRHVLSRSLIDATEAHANCPVYNWSVGTTPLGKSLAVKGALTDASEESFDSQLAEVTSPSQLGRTLGSFAYDIQQPAAQGPDDIENAFWIATPRNGTNDNRLLVRAVFQGYLIDKEIVYKLPGRSIRVRHAMLIHAVADEVLLDGDSGSPAVRTKGGNRLMGMFIAGNENIAYLIPAWQLLTPKKYGIANEPPWEVVSI